MSILRVIGRNLKRGPETVRYPVRPEAPQGYRGFLRLDDETCITCGICSYVCPSAAVKVEDLGDHGQWTYDPSRCTFCGRCMDHCPVQALTMEAAPLPSASQKNAREDTHRLTYPVCRECGEPIRPVNEVILAAIQQKLRQRTGLCSRCRRLRPQAAIRSGFVPKTARTDEKARGKNGKKAAKKRAVEVAEAGPAAGDTTPRAPGPTDFAPGGGESDA